MNAEVTSANGFSWILVILLLFFIIAIILCSIAHWYLQKEKGTL